MANFENLKKLLKPSMCKISEEVSMLINQELSAGEPDFLMTNQKTLFVDRDDPSIIVPLSLTGEHEGSVYLLFTLKEAIAASSALLGIPPARIKEKRRFVLLEPDDLDAFAEIANIITGSLNTTFGELPEVKGHLSLQPNIRFTPQETTVDDKSPIPDQDYFLCIFPFGNADVDEIKMHVLIPAALASSIDPGGETPEQEGVVDEADSTPVEAEVAPAKGVILVFEDDVDHRDMLEAILTKAGFTCKVVQNEQNIQEEAIKNNSPLLVMGITDVGDKEISMCIKINNANAMSLSSNTIIVMAAQRWIRSNVLKAVKYGVKDILLKPYEKEDVIKRITRLLTMYNQ